MDYPRIPISEMHLGKFPDSLAFQSSKVNQHQDSSMCKISVASHHYALDQRSWDIRVNERSSDIAIDYRATRFPRLRFAWCDDCVCIEGASHACALPQKELVSKRSVLRKTSDFYEEGNLPTWSLSIFEPPKLVKLYKVYQIYSVYAYIQNDDVQDFDTRWDQALLAASEIPT